DGRTVDSADDLVSAIRAARPGQEVELTYYEGDRLNRKSVRLAAPTATPPGSPSGIAGPGGAGYLPDVGGFDVPPAPPTGSAPGGVTPRLGPGPGVNRPLLQKIEELAENLARPTGTTTVYDPLAMAALQTRGAQLSDKAKDLGESIKVFEE